MEEMTNSRREFLEFMGLSVAAATLESCAHQVNHLPFESLAVFHGDELKLAKGFQYDVLVKWGEVLTTSGAKFGFNNDYIAYLPLDPARPLEGLMWVNHEYHDPVFCSGWKPGTPHTRAQMDIERREVGGSILHVKKDGTRWNLVANSKFNRRIDGTTEIPFAAPRKIFGATKAIGTLGGCAGGVTPWGTVLSCEENYHDFYGEAVFENGKRRVFVEEEYLAWTQFYPLPPEHYGWVVEVDLKTGHAKKLTAMGRFCHEGATTKLTSDGRCVVYMGDDAPDEHIYKFVSRRPGSLEHGDLYVADVAAGRWLLLNRERDARLKKEFTDQTDLLIYARRAAKILGATPMARPEDIEIDPRSGAVFVSLTNNPKHDDLYGSILKILEKNNDPLAMEFTTQSFLKGGPQSKVVCPDNLAFDVNANLWICTDVSGKHMLGKEEYKSYGQNSLFYVPVTGVDAGLAKRVAVAPPGAEFTGLCFAPDGQTLFLSVQHPGEPSRNETPLSHWPDGGDKMPRPSVIALAGPAMTALLKSPS